MDLKKILIKNLESCTEVEAPHEQYSKTNPALTKSIPKSRVCCNTDCGRSFSPQPGAAYSDYCCSACKKAAIGLISKPRLRGAKTKGASS